jgi:hypothetical protein
MTSLKPTTPPKAPARLPTWRELIEQEEQVREILRARMRRKSEKVIAGPVVTPILNGDVARVIELPAGGWRIEHWVKGTGWIEAPHGAFDLGDFMPGYTRPVAAKDAARLGCGSRISDAIGRRNRQRHETARSLSTCSKRERGI